MYEFDDCHKYISKKNTFKGICKMAKYVHIKHLPFCDIKF